MLLQQGGGLPECLQGVDALCRSAGAWKMRIPTSVSQRVTDQCSPSVCRGFRWSRHFWTAASTSVQRETGSYFPKGLNSWNDFNFTQPFCILSRLHCLSPKCAGVCWCWPLWVRLSGRLKCNPNNNDERWRKSWLLWLSMAERWRATKVTARKTEDKLRCWKPLKWQNGKITGQKELSTYDTLVTHVPMKQLLCHRYVWINVTPDLDETPKHSVAHADSPQTGSSQWTRPDQDWNTPPLTLWEDWGQLDEGPGNLAAESASHYIQQQLALTLATKLSVYQEAS